MKHASDYTFSPVEHRDLDLLETWLNGPLLRDRGDPSEELEDIEGDLRDPSVTALLVRHRGQPFAYIQDQDVRRWPQPHLLDLPTGTRALDTFLGDATMVDHQYRYIRERASQLHLSGTRMVVADLLEEDVCAQIAYRRAGFEPSALIHAGSAAIIRLLCCTPD
ncbi:MAG: GNAT family N-acetyltransferase [Pseudomonadota bacterium]